MQPARPRRKSGEGVIEVMRLSDLFTCAHVMAHYRFIGTPLKLEPNYNVCWG